MADGLRREKLSAMLDTAQIDLCAVCLAGAAAYGDADADLGLSATAFARDLTDVAGDEAPELLEAALELAVEYLDSAGELDGPAFARALRRLFRLRTRLRRRLDSAVQPVRR